MPGISDGAVSLDVGIQHTVQVRGISPELFQVAVCLIAGEGRRPVSYTQLDVYKRQVYTRKRANRV